MLKVHHYLRRKSWQFIRYSFPFWERLGFHITPNHFYQPIPDTRTLRSALWEQCSEMAGVNWNDSGQLKLLETFAANYREEIAELPRETTGVPHQYFVNNPGFSGLDGVALYCMIRHFQPRRIVEIGSGMSTYLAAQAHLRNGVEGAPPCELVAIEPYPNAVLRAGFPGLSGLIPKLVQDTPLNEFERLGENDVLFIDSSHVLKIGSDVQFEYLEVLPRLRPGVLVHAHDIFLPAEYPKEWVLNNRAFLTEQYLLHAFLIGNDGFRVLWGGNSLCLRHRDRLRDAFGDDVITTGAGSFWMQKVL